VGLLSDMAPDWDWAKRGGTERDGSPLTVRRALVLRSMQNLRLPVFVVVSSLPIYLTDVLPPDQNGSFALVLGLIFLAFIIFLLSIFADWDRFVALTRVDSHLTKMTGGVKDFSGALTVLAAALMVICCLAFSLSLRSLPVVGETLTHIHNFVRQFPLLLAFMMVLLVAECERMRGLMQSTDTIMDRKIDPAEFKAAEKRIAA
jgi:hypothetical protein